MTEPAVPPIPDGMNTLIPHLICAGAADAIEFYKKAFGALELSRLPRPDGKLMHAAVQIGGSVLMLNDEFPDWGALSPKARGGTAVTIHRYVEDVDAAVAQAVAAGATLKMPVADMFWGDRYGIVEDPFGHLWSLATRKKEVKPEDYAKAMAEQPPPMPPKE